jgi:hypothetical protein
VINRTFNDSPDVSGKTFQNFVAVLHLSITPAAKSYKLDTILSNQLLLESPTCGESTRKCIYYYGIISNHSLWRDVIFCQLRRIEANVADLICSTLLKTNLNVTDMDFLHTLKKTLRLTSRRTTQWFLVLRKNFFALTSLTKTHQKPLSDLFNPFQQRERRGAAC